MYVRIICLGENLKKKIKNYKLHIVCKISIMETCFTTADLGSNNDR